MLEVEDSSMPLFVWHFCHSSYIGNQPTRSPTLGHKLLSKEKYNPVSSVHFHNLANLASWKMTTFVFSWKKRKPKENNTKKVLPLVVILIKLGKKPKEKRREFCYQLQFWQKNMKIKRRKKLLCFWL